MEQNYKLNSLKTLIAALISQEADKNTLKALVLESAQLPDTIRARVFTFYSAEMVAEFIAWHQEGLVKMMDQLYLHKQLMRSYQGRYALLILSDLLKTLVKLFPRQTSNDLSIPRVWLDREVKKLLPLWDHLKMEWKSRGVEQQLITLAGIPLVDFIAPRHPNPVTFSEHEYMKCYVSELLCMNLDSKKYKSTDQLLIERLLMLNYNSEGMQEYCISGIKKQLEKCKENKKQMYVLTIAKKALNQVVAIEGLCYDKKFAPIILTISSWLDEEMIFVRDIPAKMLNALQNPFKVLRKLCISVPVMAYLARLLINHGVYEKDETAVLGHIVDTYCSKETDRMSPKNFYNNFNQPTDAAVRAVRKILRAMLAEADDFLSTGGGSTP